MRVFVRGFSPGGEGQGESERQTSFASVESTCIAHRSKQRCPNKKVQPMKAAPSLSDGAERIRSGSFPVPQITNSLHSERQSQQCTSDESGWFGNGRIA